VIGAGVGAILVGGIGAPADGEEGLVQLPVLSTLGVMVLAGAVLGAATAAVTQALAVPVAIEEGTADEIETVKGRLTGAIRIPIAGLVLLALLVLPFAWVLIRSAHLTSAGAPIVAIFTAIGILGFAALAGSRPNMRISFGELMVAVIGIGTVIVVALSVLSARGPAEEASTGPGGTIGILAGEDLSFDATEWTVPEGPVDFVYTDEGDVVHTLAIEGLEDEMLLEVETAGQVDQGTVTLSPGAYTLYCTIRGHREAGMEGTLEVTPAPAEPAEDG
jgi:plastocyanin